MRSAAGRENRRAVGDGKVERAHRFLIAHIARLLQGSYRCDRRAHRSDEGFSGEWRCCTPLRGDVAIEWTVYALVWEMIHEERKRMLAVRRPLDQIEHVGAEARS
jgi:hypothetical protein